HGRYRKDHSWYGARTRFWKTRTLATLADSLFAEMNGAGYSERDDAIFLNAGLLAANGTVGLASTELISFVADLGRVVERSEITLPVASFAAVDPASGEIVPLPRSFDLPQDARDRIAALAPPKDERP